MILDESCFCYLNSDRSLIIFIIHFVKKLQYVSLIIQFHHFTVKLIIKH